MVYGCSIFKESNLAIHRCSLKSGQFDTGLNVHFSSSRPVQVWEVTAQLLGLASSVALLRAIESSGNPEAVLWIWVLIQVRRLPCLLPADSSCQD